MTVDEVKALCGYQHYLLIGAHTGKKLANSLRSSKERLSKYDDYQSCGIFPSVIDVEIVAGMPTHMMPVICIWVIGE